MNMEIIQCLNRVFCLSEVVSREGYGEKILQAWNLVFVTFLCAQVAFLPFKNCCWRKEWRENSEKK